MSVGAWDILLVDCVKRRTKTATTECDVTMAASAANTPTTIVSSNECANVHRNGPGRRVTRGHSLERPLIE